MGYALAPGIHFCISNQKVALLDVGRDRYLALPPAQEEAFKRLAAGDNLSGADLDLLGPLKLTGILSEVDAPNAVSTQKPLPIRTFETGATLAPTHLSMAALATRLITHVSMKRQTLALTLAGVRRSKHKIARDPEASDTQALMTIAALRATSRWLPVKDQCLPWSVAGALFLHRHRIPADLVIGVRMRPFAAHAWLQWQGAVLNDDLDEVLPYTPILVV